MFTKKEKIMENYDVIVVGAGNGGLTASAALAQKGLNVLLLEKHNIPGGCATSFCRGRFEFEVALHQLSGLGTPDKPGQLRTELDDLGVMDDLTFVESPDLYTIRMPDGFHLSLKPDKNQIISELKEKFPSPIVVVSCQGTQIGISHSPNEINPTKIIVGLCIIRVYLDSLLVLRKCLI